jgi:osmotically-inducible protein OsmY
MMLKAQGINLFIFSLLIGVSNLYGETATGVESQTETRNADSGDSRITVDKVDEENKKPSKKDDVEITRQIRKRLVGDDHLSLYAKNVSIVTMNGLVTLKGTVDSSQEKTVVEKHARMVVNPSKIRNQLRVAPSGTAR